MEQKSQQMKFELADNFSKKRKRTEISEQNQIQKKDSKKRKLNEEDKKDSQQVDNPAIQFPKSLQTLYKQNKQFYDQFQQDSYSIKLVQDLKNKLYGNHNNYYKKRNFSKWDDPRVDQMKLEWFQNKKILDIGCGSGSVDLQILIKFNPKLIIGIDIDHQQIKQAINSFQKIINEQEQTKLLVKQMIQERQNKEDIEMDKEFYDQFEKQQKEKEQKLKGLLKEVEQLPKSLQLSIQGELSQLNSNSMLFVKQLRDKKEIPNISDLKNYLYDRICFRSENYIYDIKNIQEKFDTIICLSTTKWIHLNYGDVGIYTLFLKIYQQLEQNGYFIFEAQPWESYKKTQYKYKQFKQNYKTIELKPIQFKDYLQHIGFKHISTLTIQQGDDSIKEDKRLIQIYQKL